MTMDGYRQFAPHTQWPSTYPNALSSFLAGAAIGFEVVIKPGAANTLQVPAGTDDDQTGLTVGGKWRYVTAPVERASPGGAAQTFDVYVTAADNNFGTASDDVGPYETDLTDYSFALGIVASGAAAPTADLARKVATADWDGSQFVAVHNLIRTPTAAPPTVTALPPDPVDGDEVYFVANGPAGVVWHLRYRAAAASAYKWEFVGGPDLCDLWAPGGSSQWTSPATVGVPIAVVNGPQLVLPLAGDYDISIKMPFTLVSASVENVALHMAAMVGTTTVLGSMSGPGTQRVGVSNLAAEMISDVRATNRGKGDAINACFSTSVASMTFEIFNSVMRIRPVHVG